MLLSQRWRKAEIITTLAKKTEGDSHFFSGLANIYPICSAIYGYFAGETFCGVALPRLNVACLQ